MGNGHARLSPSNHRWPHCSGSVREEAAYPDVSGEAAIDGTGSHLLLELCLQVWLSGRTDVRAEEWVDRTIGEGHDEKPHGWLVKPDRAARVQIALDYLKRRQEELGSIAIESESQSNPGQFFNRDDWYGTTDISLSALKLLEVIDYKDGQGWVSEKDNSQLISYAAGKLFRLLFRNGSLDQEILDTWTVRMTIIQPKVKKPIRYVDVPASELWAAAIKLSVAAANTDDPNAPLVHGDWCTWCKHGRAGNCSAKLETAMEGVAIMTATDGQGKDLMEQIQSGQIAPSSMTDEQLSKVMDAGALIRKMLDQVEEETFKRLKDGKPVPGYSIGHGRSSKKWKEDEETIAKVLKGFRLKKGDIFPASLISPAKALGHADLNDKQKTKLQAFIEEAKGKEKVVKSVQVVQGSAENMFADLPADSAQTSDEPLNFM